MKTTAMEFLPSADSRPLLIILSTECEREIIENAFTVLNDMYHIGQIEEARAFIAEMFDIADIPCPGIFINDYEPETLDELVFWFLCDFDDYLEETATYVWE